MRFAVLGSTLAALTLCWSAGAVAAEKAVAIELNKATDAGGGCRLTFVVGNQTGSLLDKLSYEVAVFDAKKTVMKLVLFEFGRFPVGKTKVVELALTGVACSNISRILVNTAPACVADGADSTICLDALRTSSQANIAFDQ
jgi:hypothetical protein